MYSSGRSIDAVLIFKSEGNEMFPPRTQTEEENNNKKGKIHMTRQNSAQIKK